MMKSNNNILIKTDIDLNFKSVSDKDIDILNKYFNTYPSRSCDFSVGGVLIWKNYYDYKYAIVEDSLFLMGTWPDSDIRIFYKPSGPIDINHYFNIIRNYCKNNNLKGFIMMPEEYEPSNDEDPRPIDDVLMSDWMEYLYDIDRFTSFSGHKYGKKRNHLNYFLNHYPEFEVKRITKDLAAELISFTITFSTTHNDNKVSRYECEELLDVLKDYDKYPYLGIAIMYKGKVIGYTFGECIGDTMIVHAEKGDISFGGIYQALASRFALESLEKYPQLRYLNREDDMGSEELRRSILSYHPTLFIAKRIISL